MQGGEYRKMPYKLGPKKLCEFVKNDKLVVPEVLATTNVPKAETCPFPAVNIFVLFIYLGSFRIVSIILGRLHCLWILSRFVNCFFKVKLMSVFYVFYQTLAKLQPSLMDALK